MWKKLQKVQNIAARLILRKTNWDSITECLRELHWLPIRVWIDFKILVLVYKCLWGNVPNYLKNLITLNPVNRQGLRSEKKMDQLIVPFTKHKTFAARSFAVTGPTLWNCIPKDIKLSKIVEQFKILIRLTYITSTLTKTATFNVNINNCTTNTLVKLYLVLNIILLTVFMLICNGITCILILFLHYVMF